MIECIANRSACHLSLFNYRECICDCNEILSYIEKLPENERETYQNLQIKLKARKAITLTWEGSSFDLAEGLFHELLQNPEKLKPELQEQIAKAYETFKARTNSIYLKVFYF